jgi:precorrin-2 dehydrogenase/sirohydrochlorin ferrochelatase
VIPLGHDLAGETVLVLGAGSVGARRARRFATEARVVVVAPVAADDADDGPDLGGAERIDAAPTPDEVAGVVARHDPALVVAATDDPAVNRAAAAAARERGALVNRADRSGDRPPGDVAVPATVEDGPVTVAVSTGGSPALARLLRERIEGEVAGAGHVGAATAALRDRLRGAGVAGEPRREAVRAAVRSDDVWSAARADDPEGVERAVVAAARTALRAAGASPEAAVPGPQTGDDRTG